MTLWKRFVRWLAHDEINRARGEGRAFAGAMDGRQREQVFAEGTMHGINLMQDEIDRVVGERAGLGEATVDDLKRARGGLLH